MSPTTTALVTLNTNNMLYAPIVSIHTFQITPTVSIVEFSSSIWAEFVGTVAQRDELGLTGRVMCVASSQTLVARLEPKTTGHNR